MGITESKKAQAVSALRQCAIEHEKDVTYTFNIRVSDLCNDIADYVEELQKENSKLKWQLNEVIEDNDYYQKENGELSNSVIELEKENEELKAQNKDLCESLDIMNNRESELLEQIEKMKKNCLDVMRVQRNNLTDNYMAGMYNGMVVIYNSCFLKGDESEKEYCSKNEHNKWELSE